MFMLGFSSQSKGIDGWRVLDWEDGAVFADCITEPDVPGVGDTVPFPPTPSLFPESLPEAAEAKARWKGYFGDCR